MGGFGSSVYFVPLAGFYFNFHTVLGITAIFHLSSNLSKIALFREGIDKRLLIGMGIPSVLFVIAGGLLSKYFSPDVLVVLLGVFLVSLSLFFMLKPEIRMRTDKRGLVINGAFSGFAAGLIGTGGAIRGIALAAFNLEKNVFVATSAAIDFCIDLSRSVVYGWNGYLNSEALIYIPALLIIGFAGTWIGKKILTRISQERFRSFTLLLILLIGLASLVKPLITLNR